MSPAERVADVVEGLSTTDDPWTTRGAIRGKVREQDGVSQPQSKSIASDIEAFDCVFVWFGFVVRADPDVIRAAIEHEREGDFSRDILVEQLQDRLSEVSDQ